LVVETEGRRSEDMAEQSDVTLTKLPTQKIHGFLSGRKWGEDGEDCIMKSLIKCIRVIKSRRMR
jgi:hypothetical protein